MTLSLTHPLVAEAKILDPKQVEAALASLSYWSVPSAAPEVAEAEETDLDQMYAYF